MSEQTPPFDTLNKIKQFLDDVELGHSQSIYDTNDFSDVKNTVLEDLGSVFDKAKESELLPIYKRAYTSMTEFAIEQRNRLDAIETLLIDVCEYYGLESCNETCDCDPNGWEGCFTRKILDIIRPDTPRIIQFTCDNCGEKWNLVSPNKNKDRCPGCGKLISIKTHETRFKEET